MNNNDILELNTYENSIADPFDINRLIKERKEFKDINLGANQYLSRKDILGLLSYDEDINEATDTCFKQYNNELNNSINSFDFNTIFNTNSEYDFYQDSLNASQIFDEDKTLLLRKISDAKDLVGEMIIDENTKINNIRNNNGFYGFNNLEKISGPEFSKITESNNSLFIGNKTSLNIQDSVSIVDDISDSVSLADKEINSFTDKANYTNISVRTGRVINNINCGSSYSKNNITFKYHYGNSYSKTTIEDKIEIKNMFFKSYSNIRADNIYELYKGTAPNTNSVGLYKFGDDISGKTVTRLSSHFTFTFVQLSLWIYFSIIRAINMGHTKLEHYTSGISVEFTGVKKEEKKIIEKALASELNTTQMKNNADIINRYLSKQDFATGRVSKTTGKLHLYGNADVQTIAKISFPFKPLKENEVKEVAKVQTTEVTKGPNFIGSTIMVLVKVVMYLIFGVLSGKVSRFSSFKHKIENEFYDDIKYIDENRN